ncbi:Fic family protein [Hymenobacter arizonensis]|uniref:protein adenylyltransferase n=1 Tax=Hymenobacter arizonensis TaxID=1227077 RepID=A0A1I6BH30_HYMAR|nr:Fic family protein [Hymenobacter arizonensis]SFQ80249.1 Fido, protein-threonine AMPylation domain-containing protein [Hymenobacter arizonensis]
MDLFQDPLHSRPNNEVLINKLGITTQQELREAEGANLGRMALLVEGIKPIPGDFDAAHLKQIHQELLGNIYPWAGETRAWGQFQGQKHLPNGSLFFAPYQQIEARLNLLGNQLTQENQLKGLDEDQFVKRLTYYADQYNYVHPFREGNGRTLQVILAEVGRRAGYDVRISEQQIKEYNPARDAAILRKNGLHPDENLAPLRRLLALATTPAEGPQAEQLRHPALARPVPAPSPGMQQAEALRTLIVGSREVSEERVMQRVTKHHFKVSPDYLQQAKAQEAALVASAQAVQREPATWPAFRQQLLERVKQVEADPGITRGSLAHLAHVKKASAELDRNQALTPAFREQEVPADQLTRLGKPVAELWKLGQMEKLLQGQRTDHLPFPMPNPQGGPQHVPMQLQLNRDAAGAVGVEVYLPAAVRERMEQAAAQQRPQTSQQQQPPVQQAPTPQVEAPSAPQRRRGPKR